MPTRQDLQKRYKAARLSSKGSKTELTKRMRESCEDGSPESEENPMCDALLATQAKISSDEAMKIDAKLALGRALDDELQVKNVWGTMYVGNRRGLDLADLQERFHQRDIEIASLKQTASTQQNQIAQLDDRLSSLCLSLKEYKQVRERFLGTFKRDVLKNATRKDYAIIQTGNATAHGGDVVGDALLYEGVEGRHDSNTFIQLYGMTPSDAQKIQHKETIQILNTHAGVRADTKKKGANEYYRRFRVFIEKFEQSDHDTDYLKAECPTDVTRAYGDLLNCEKYENMASEKASDLDCVVTL